MKQILSLIFCSLLISSCSKNFFQKSEKVEASEEFVQGSEDIPLLLGMEKMPDESLGFDTASGSIIASSYTTKNDLQLVKKFYLETLPQMGWKLEQSSHSKTSFNREKEKLEIEFSKENEQKMVKFFISSSL
jgi:hypothetical protein